MTLEELNRLRQIISELGLEEKDVLEKVEKAAQVEMIDRGWEAPYRYWGLGGVTRGDASDEEVKADAERHGLSFDPDNVTNITDAYQGEFEALIWEKLEAIKAEIGHQQSKSDNA